MEKDDHTLTFVGYDEGEVIITVDLRDVTALGKAKGPTRLYFNGNWISVDQTNYTYEQIETQWRRIRMRY